jgi:hypothetical protein
METIQDYLHKDPEVMPDWLGRHCPGDHFNRELFFSGRTVFYPGSATDGHPVKLFGSAWSAHCFIYTDYILDKARIERDLEDPTAGIRGYHRIDRIALSINDFAPHGWTQHGPRTRKALGWVDRNTFVPYGFVEVMERDHERPPSYGVDRLAVLFLGADAHATFDALYCQKDGTPPPFAVLLQDHGFGCNYSAFGAGGIISKLVTHCHVYPRYLLIARNTTPWPGFQPVPDLLPDRGGMHSHERDLYVRQVSGEDRL